LGALRPVGDPASKTCVSAVYVSLCGMDEREDAELAELAALLRERNALEARLGPPVESSG
jgi:hypothetical protein